MVVSSSWHPNASLCFTRSLCYIGKWGHYHRPLPNCSGCYLWLHYCWRSVVDFPPTSRLWCTFWGNRRWDGWPRGSQPTNLELGGDSSGSRGRRKVGIVPWIMASMWVNVKYQRCRINRCRSAIFFIHDRTRYNLIYHLWNENEINIHILLYRHWNWLELYSRCTEGSKQPYFRIPSW